MPTLKKEDLDELIQLTLNPSIEMIELMKLVRVEGWRRTRDRGHRNCFIGSMSDELEVLEEITNERFIKSDDDQTEHC